MENEQQSGKAPCYGCYEREIGCHGVCRRYISWKEKHEAEREARLKQEGQQYVRNEAFFQKLARHRNRSAKLSRKQSAD